MSEDLLGLTEILCQLESHQLTTILVPCKRPSNEGGCIRVNADENPRWYRRLCEKYPSSRVTRRGKHDTVLRRANVLCTLRVMSSGKNSRSKYAPELRQIAAKILK